LFQLSLWYLLCQPLCPIWQCCMILAVLLMDYFYILWFCCCTTCGSLELWISKNENRLEMRFCTDCGHILSDKLPYDVCWCKLHIVSHFIFVSPWQLLNYMKFFSPPVSLVHLNHSGSSYMKGSLRPLKKNWIGKV